MKNYWGFRKAVLVALFALTCLTTTSSMAANGSNRMMRRIGFTAGLFSDPFPGTVGLAVRYNLTDFFQVHGGYGYLSTSSGGTSTTTSAFGIGGRFFVPRWNLSPFVGFNYSYWSASGSISLLGSTITISPSVMYITFGLDWQTGMGFNIGAGAHYLLAPKTLTQFLTFIPQGYIGWYF